MGKHSAIPPEEKPPVEGYLFVVYGKLKYLRYAYASAVTIRRHDTSRPIAIACQPEHRAFLEAKNIRLFDHVVDLAPEHASIVGFKHNFHKYLVFDRTLFLDSDIVCCRNPNDLWKALGANKLSITGNLVSDPFFGSAKGPGILKDLLFHRRRRTLERFGLTYLSRVQSGVMFSRDPELTEEVCTLASDMLRRKSETHFQSRLKESGRNEESCEWSLAMAMSKLGIPVFPWIQGQNSPQVDYIDYLVRHDEAFNEVTYRLYTHDSVYRLRGIKSPFWRKLIMGVYTAIPGFSDYMEFSPYFLHFGWLHQKAPFEAFSRHVFTEFDPENKI